MATTLRATGWIVVAYALIACPSSTLCTETPLPGPNLVYKAEPVYPKAARDKGEHGIVVIRVQIDSTGHVLRAEVDRRRPDETPKPLIEEAAMAAAKRCRFAPTTSIPSWIVVPFMFAPTIVISLTASNTDFAVQDSIAVTAKVTSDSRTDSVQIEMTFPTNPYGILARPLAVGVPSPQVIPTTGQGYAASVARRAWSLDLDPKRPVTLRATFAATSCGSSSIRVRCMTTDGSNVVVDQVLPICIRGLVGDHFPEYQLSAAGDSTKRALRVDDRVFSQQADSCCSFPTPPSK